MNNYSQFKERFFQLYKPTDKAFVCRTKPHMIVCDNKIMVAPNGKYVWQSLGAAKGALNTTIQSFGKMWANSKDDIPNYINQMIEDGIIEFVPLEMIDDSQES